MANHQEAATFKTCKAMIQEPFVEGFQSQPPGCIDSLKTKGYQPTNSILQKYTIHP
jgi:hypothetical protein